MATRRPRVKPTAILQTRRPQSALRIEPPPATTSLKAELCDDIGDGIDASQSNHDSDYLNARNVFAQNVNETGNPIGSEANADLIETKPEIGDDEKNSNGQTSSNNESCQRIINPTVNTVNREKFPTENRPFNHASPVHNVRSPAHMRSPAQMKSPAYSYMYENAAAASPRKLDEKPISSPKMGATNEDEVFSPAPENDECFKSPPFMSPSIYSRRPDPNMSPYTDAFGGEDSKSHGTALSNKIRQRIRPTPCFNRRNSIQGMSETDDDIGRRQRHYSTSSTYSNNYNAGNTPQQSQRNYFGLNKTYSRIRTESMCSNASEAASARDLNTRPKQRMHRSEEFQRVANAKREFNQRLNGKAPDKSRLTMYDMIYYNPVTNPMTRPAIKSEMKDRTDNLSVSSIRTIESRHSVKSEPKVKAENTDSNQDVMPVPQLKLGPNGEIILDEKSLVIEMTGNKKAREMLANSDIIYDDEFSGTSGFYKRHKRTKDWPPEETIKFYRSLQAVGTDFSVMVQLFPNRSRRDLKLKFKKEERHNMVLINKALLQPKEFNIEELQLQFDKEDRDKEAKKVEWADLAQKISRERKEQINVIKKRTTKKIVSLAARCLTAGDKLYENEFVQLPKHPARKVKRTAWDNNGIESESHSIGNSPMSSNPFTQPSTPMRSPTYATHKLPSFNEMISSQKSSTYNANAANNERCGTENAQSTNLIVVPSDAELPVSVSMAPITSTAIASESNDIVAAIGTYAAKSNADDIMSMDIIFDDVSIEEDPTIGNNVPIIQETPTASIPPDNVQYENNESNGAERPTQSVDNANSTILLAANALIEFNEIAVESENVVIMPTAPTVPAPAPSQSQNDADASCEPKIDNGNTWQETAAAPKPLLVETISNESVDNPTRQHTQNRQTNETHLKSESEIECEKSPTKSGEDEETVAATNTSLKRKRKPLHMPIGRNKKAKATDSQELIAYKTDDKVNDDKLAQATVAALTEPSTSSHFNDQQTHCSSVDEKPIETSDEIVSNNEPNETAENSFMDSLVVVESQDPNDPTKTIHEVHFICPETKEMFEQPLDLPDEVIQRIRLSMMSGAE